MGKLSELNGGKSERLMASYILSTPVPFNNETAIRNIGLLDYACDVVGMSIGEMIGDCREYEIAAKRFAVWAFLRARGMSYKRIADMCKKDHSSIYHGVARYHAICARYKEGKRNAA